MSDPSSPFANLLEDPWIPVIPCHGPPRETGLRELLLQARDFHGLNETAPPSLVALHRLLLAVVHRALTLHHGPWKNADRKRWLRDGLPKAALSAYLDQWQDHFWLFHPERPFMQVPALASAPETRDKAKPWTQIALHAATGNAPTLFDHTVDTFPEAAGWPLVFRNLLGFLQFTPGGLVKCFRGSDKAGALVNTAAVIPLGQTIEETLILGLHPFSVQAINDLPAWEQLAPTTTQLSGDPQLHTGPNDRYTRLSRAVLLLPEGDGTIREIRFGAGVALADDPNQVDPMACFRYNAKGEPIRVTFNEGRATWRDLPSLLPDQSGKASRPPQVLHWACEALEGLEAEVLVAGMASDQAKLLRWRMDRFQLPVSMLVDPRQADELRLLLGRGEEAFRKAKDLVVEAFTQALPSPGHLDTKKRARAMAEASPLQATFFARLERSLPGLLTHLSAMDADAATTHWMTTQKEATEQGWHAALETLGRTPSALRAEARVRPRYLALIRSLQPTPQETPCHE